MKSIFLRLHNRDGVGLIDVLIGMAILTIGLSSAYLLTLHASSMISRGQFVSAAASLAEYKIEELRNEDFTLIASGNDGGTIDSQANAGGIYTRSWVVVDDTPVAGLKTVTVTVDWDQGGQARDYALTGVINDPAGGGP